MQLDFDKFLQKKHSLKIRIYTAKQAIEFFRYLKLYKFKWHQSFKLSLKPVKETNNYWAVNKEKTVYLLDPINKTVLLQGENKEKNFTLAELNFKKKFKKLKYRNFYYLLEARKKFSIITPELETFGMYKTILINLGYKEFKSKGMFNNASAIVIYPEEKIFRLTKQGLVTPEYSFKKIKLAQPERER